MNDITRERLRKAIEWNNTNPSAVAHAFGKEEHYYRDFLKGKKKTLTSEGLSFAATFLGVALKIQTKNIEEPKTGLSASKDRHVPLYSAKLSATADRRFIFENTTDILCPSALSRVRGVYAVRMPDDSMEPRFFAGETLFVDPSRSIRPGVFIVVKIKNGESEYAYIKQVVDEKLTLRQFNPEKKFSVPLDSVLHAHVIQIVYSN